MKPVFKIDGVDFSWILNEGSISWSRNDLDSDKTNRMMNGDMFRSRIAVKRKLKLSNLRRMNTAQIKSLNDALYPPLIRIEVTDPLAGGVFTGTFYGSTVESTMQVYDRVADDIYWENTAFSLTQK